MKLPVLSAAAALSCALAAPLTTLAHGNAGHGAAAAPEIVETAFGRTGDPNQVTRTIRVDLTEMKFKPAAITIRQGETVRFRVHNVGRILHELVIGTEDELRQHAKLMRANPDMEHEAPYMAHVENGQRADIVWQFTKAGEFHYGCLIPGHFEMGMRGRLRVLPR